MKVAQLTCVWPPSIGGIGKVAFEYSKILANDYQVTVFTPQYRKDQQVEKIANLRIELLPSILKIGNAAWLPQLTSKLKEFDIIHLHYPFFGVQEFIKAKLPAKLIVSYHMVATANGVKRWLFNLDSSFSERKLKQVVKIWLVSSADYAEHIVRPRLGQGVEIKILPFGADDEFIPGNKSEHLLLKLNIKQGAPVLLFVGGLDQAHYFKGVDILIKALAQLRDKDFKMIIVGEGNLKNYYQKLAKKLGLGTKIIFTGYLTNKELPDYYRLADGFIFPSLNQAEAFGLALLQALACGVPVVASNLVGVRSLVIPGKTGLLVEPGDTVALTQAISKLITRLPEARVYGQTAARIVSNQYRWQIIGKKLLEIYSEL